MGFLGWTAFFAWRSARHREKIYKNTLDQYRGAFCCFCCDWCGDCNTPADFCRQCAEIIEYD